MAVSTFAMDVPNTLVNDTVNAPAAVNANFTEVQTQFNAAMETATGHYHDGTDSRIVYGGLSGWTMEDTMFMTILGAFRNGGGL